MNVERSAAVAQSGDLRLREATWDPRGTGVAHRMRLIGFAHSVAALWYFGWLLQPARVGHPVLYGLLVAAEVFNLVQAAGFWWTVAHERVRDSKGSPGKPPVDVFIPVYDEPVEVVEPTVAAATRLRGAEVRVALLDDGVRDDVRALAERHDARYISREESTGAKAGNINHALPLTSAPYVLVLDCDHVPSPRFLERTLGPFADPHLGFVQTPQYYANATRGGVAAAAWGQQALFFGAIARGKDGMGAMFCCGTNVVYRRAALHDVGGFPEESVTEDFELSIRLHERGWNSAYVPEVLANGLGPEDMAAYVGQQDRWARGCLAGFTVALRAKLPWRLKVQYVLSSMFFFTGWTFLLYMLFPVIRIVTGGQPIGGASADLFILHFAPYFAIALLAVGAAGAGVYTFGAFSLMVANFSVHVRALVANLLRRPSGFTVTPKEGEAGPQPRAVWPALALIAVLTGTSVYGLIVDRSPATLNNVAFAALHVAVLTRGVLPALRPPRPAPLATTVAADLVSGEAVAGEAR